MDVTEKLLEREKEYDLCKKEVDGFQFWQYERFHIWTCLRTSEELFKKDTKPRNIGKLMHYYIKNAIRIKKGSTVDICFLSHARRCLQGNVYECIYTDALAEKFPHSVTLEKFYEMQHLEPLKSSNVVYLDRIVIKANIYSKLAMKLFVCRNKRIKNAVYRELQTALKDILTVKQLDEFALHALKNFYLHRYYYKKFKQLVLLMNPKIMVEVVACSTHTMVMNEVCKDLGVKTIELQHGIIERENITYNYSCDATIRQFPDKIFLFGDYYKQDVRYPLNKDCLVPIGFPYFEREIKQRSKNKRTDHRYTILILSQGIYTRGLSELAINLQELVRDRGMRILYKLHPNEYTDWRSLHPGLEESGVEVVGQRGISLYDCLATSDVQVGVYSTAIYEGLGFGIRTFIFSQEGAQFMRRLIELGIAELIGSAEELLEKLRQKREVNYEIDFFWKQNALENMVKSLQRELNATLMKD